MVTALLTVNMSLYALKCRDGGSRVSLERAGEAEWSERRKGKTEQEDVQSGLNGARAALIAIMAVGAFFVRWYNGAKDGRVKGRIGIWLIQQLGK